MHVKAKTMAFSGLLLALTVIFMVLGSVIETSTLFLLAAASFFVGIIIREFGPAMTGWLDSVLSSGGYTETAMQAAADALAGSNPIGDCLSFGNGNWGIQIGDHFFH